MKTIRIQLFPGGYLAHHLPETGEHLALPIRALNYIRDKVQAREGDFLIHVDTAPFKGSTRMHQESVYLGYVHYGDKEGAHVSLCVQELRRMFDGIPKVIHYTITPTQQTICE